MCGVLDGGIFGMRCIIVLCYEALEAPRMFGASYLLFFVPLPFQNSSSRPKLGGLSPGRAAVNIVIFSTAGIPVYLVIVPLN